MVERGIKGCDVDELWKKLSDVQSIPKYWHGHREVTVLEKDKNKYKVQIMYAFPSLGNGNVGKSIIEVDDRKKVLSFDNFEGPVKGKIRIWIDEDKRSIFCTYNVEMSPIYSITKGLIEYHFKQGVEHAFDRLIESQKRQVNELLGS